MMPINKELLKDMMAQLPESKKIQFQKACQRNHMLTSTYGFYNVKMTVYKEGWYVIFTGTRCQFQMFVRDMDGEFKFERKPIEHKLHKLYEDGETSEVWAL